MFATKIAHPFRITKYSKLLLSDKSLKQQKRMSLPLIFGGQVSISDFLVPLVKERLVGRCTGCLLERPFPVFFGVVEQAVEVKIIHHDPYHCGQPREAPLPFQSFLHDQQKQVGDQSHPYLCHDSVRTFAIELFQWEVLFYLLGQQIDFPELAVDGNDFVRV